MLVWGNRTSRSSPATSCSIIPIILPPWLPIRTYKGAPAEYVHRLGQNEADLPRDDLSILLRAGRQPSEYAATHRGVRYMFWSDSDAPLLALDESTGARLGVTVSPVIYATRISADDDGVTLTEGEGNTVVYPLRR